MFIMKKSVEGSLGVIQAYEDFYKEFDVSKEKQELFREQQFKNTDIPSGGVKFLEGNEILFTRAMLKERSNYTFYVLAIEEPTLEDASIIGELEELTKYYTDVLIPEIE